VLEGIPAEQAERIRRAARRRRFAAGEVVFHEGDTGDTVHLVLKGRLAVLVTSSYGQQLTYEVVSAGEFFGELGLLSDDHVRSATVRAFEATETLAISRGDFERLRSEHPSVTELLVRILTQRVLRLSEQLRESVHLPVEVRIRRRLLRLGELYGGGAPGTQVPLTQEDLAALTGTARATVNRVLRQDAQNGIVELGRHRVTILDPEALARRAGSTP
jgi:CRP-like cAMP-binding protein